MANFINSESIYVTDRFTKKTIKKEIIKKEIREDGLLDLQCEGITYTVKPDAVYGCTFDKLVAVNDEITSAVFNALS